LQHPPANKIARPDEQVTPIDPLDEHHHKTKVWMQGGSAPETQKVNAKIIRNKRGGEATFLKILKSAENKR